MNRSFFNEVFLVKYDQHFYKLIIPCSLEVNSEHIAAIADKKMKRLLLVL